MCCEKFIYLFKVKYPMLLHCFNQYPFAQNKKKKKWKHLLIHLCRFYFSYFHFFLGHIPSLSLNTHKVRPLTPLSNAGVTLYVSCGTAGDCITISSIFARVSTRYTSSPFSVVWTTYCEWPKVIVQKVIKYKCNDSDIFILKSSFLHKKLIYVVIPNTSSSINLRIIRKINLMSFLAKRFECRKTRIIDDRFKNFKHG